MGANAPHTADVAIVGGGLVGSVLARWLAAGGARVLVAARAADRILGR